MLTKKLSTIEKSLDFKANNLSIYQESFQSILSALYLTAGSINHKGDDERAMDYISRISEIFPLIQKKAKKIEVEYTLEALKILKDPKIQKDIEFLNAYAHFCLIMPQIYRGTLEIKSIDNKRIKLDYSSEQILNSELIDKLYSTISLPISIKYSANKEIKNFTDKRAKNGVFSIDSSECRYIHDLYLHHLKYSINIEVLPNNIIEGKIGFNNDDYRKFISILKAISDYHIIKGDSFYEKSFKKGSSKVIESHYNEYLLNTVCLYDHKSIGIAIGISGISQIKFLKILSYFINIYSNKTREDIQSKAFISEGFLAPITLIDDQLLFSPLGLRYMLSFNNILYSINQNDKKLFDNHLSHELEPVLINQLKYLFSKFENLNYKSNIKYKKSEIDLLVHDSLSKTVISIQVKTTIAPDSSRSVARVQSRTQEALEQTKKFEELSSQEKLQIVNDAFNKQLDDLKYINLIVLRSSAGSDKAWEINKTYRIVNYTFLAKILSDKLISGNKNFKDFDEFIIKKQNEMLFKSEWECEYNKLKIDEYEIEFPNITFNSSNLLLDVIKLYKYYPNIELQNPFLNS